MAKNCKIETKTLKKIVEETLRHTAKPEVTDIVEIIRPFYAWNKTELVERELKNKARYIMSTFKDENKARTYFLDNNGVYINVEKSTDLVEMDKVHKQLRNKYSGLSGAITKVQNRIEIVIERYSWKKAKRG